MKEAVGEGSMTIITIVLVTLALGSAVAIIGGLLNSQRNRTACENAGAFWDGGCRCTEGGEVITKDETTGEYVCSE